MTFVSVFLLVQNILFIVNPISHEVKSHNIEKTIKQNLDLKKYSYKIVYTEYPQHATYLAQLAVHEKVDIVAVIGGDGTIHEVGKALTGSNTALALIPAGSGNGLARHLGIPVNIPKAIKALNHSHPKWIDTLSMNGETFLVTAGIGFDAFVALKFSEFGKRGLSSYLQVAMNEYLNYTPLNYEIEIDGKILNRTAFLISFANASQYGNDFIIAPHAKLHDGKMDVTIVRNLPFNALPEFIFRSFHGSLDHSHHVEIFQCTNAVIRNKGLLVHVDGEPLTVQEELKIQVNPRSLKIMSP